MQVTGRTPLVVDQQSYDITFSPPFLVAPTSFYPALQMPDENAEVFYVDYTNLTPTGATLVLSGLPTSLSLGGYITWQANGVTGSSASSGITVSQLFHRIGRRSRTGDVTKLSMTEITDVLDAANFGLQKLYNALPVYFKEQTQGFALAAPATISTSVTQYSKAVTASTFTTAQIGCTVQLDGDKQWNQIIGTETLLNPYMGATGTVSGTVYGDAITSDTYPLDRIIGNPRFPNRDQWPINPLNQGWPGQMYGWWLGYNSIGVPCSWWPQVLGGSQGNAPMVILKFAPLPDVAYPVQVRLSFWPKRLTLDDYLLSTTLAVPSQFIEPALIPFCVESFMGSPAWLSRSPADDAAVAQKAGYAEMYLREQPAQVALPANRIFCPVGF